MKLVEMEVDEVMKASVKSDGFPKDGTSTFYMHISGLMQYQEGGI